MATNNLTFRFATEEEAPDVQQLIHRAFRAEDSRPNWTGDMELSTNFSVDIELIRARINTPNCGFVVATNGQGQTVGTICVAQIANKLARMSLLAIEPQHQQGGTGRQVLEYAEKHSQQAWGATRCGLNALSTRKELISWYKRHGYQETGELVPFPQQAYTPGTAGNDLYFVEMLKHFTP
ncbi:hypothetical protein HJFPF1_08191 [Paramyrothecium foliicola]|nr:hypothetical protein HJFPF1_08191 [Paramyrothecium foliicola]